ncbi:DNA (cytosine-5)-methyltransferase 1 [Bradyrhizobium japonicum]|uniref:DNA cytosine methyltransferase n=1 Tax=Bradyrhizobium elkanii TaxID=29448 RepID=UPI000365834D|nr:DNA cytosine methyltransferase [Bradyrhizobium elkanii]WAX24335.1 DNA cytosine methyltransferase [Bradyrhizobium phage ppBeUSDA76-1]MCP1731288.1 DNA (cytosine-5)-methyltransferase 1 [Bradyrhizobium elkanii]MCS3575417.1 DNA (cytosine-5)-methyltransferase 1 [Bradyrhizobium elkanii]MCS3591892.1 DNA (cytosine-5)-methyltransferase 1 [Bradyrhizobium elkanii]MCS3621337.1 DNA (cytosine-5)-methyltransferase 1 [Bradyrhizobium elkanii]
MTQRKIVVDLFCGSGGSSEGAEEAFNRLGLDIDLRCLNHWPVAIETHWRNHPAAIHYCQDIATARPQKVVPEGYVDLLMASPSCTHHSPARGGRPTSDQLRSDPWHIIPWLTELRVSRMIVENVWAYVKWGPVDPETQRPIKEREGEYYRAWIETIRSLGATSIEWRKLNAADFGGFTTRERYFGFFRFDGRPLLLPVATHAKRSRAEAKGLKPWRPARDIIDWSIKGRSIFARPRPLAPKTIARILAGAIKFDWPGVLIWMLVVELQRSLMHALRFCLARRHSSRADLQRRNRKRVMVYVEWLRKIRDGEVTGGAGDAAPMLVTLRNNADGRSVASPAPTIAANGTHLGLAQPIIIKQHFRRDQQSVDEPAPASTGVARIGLVEPFLLNRHGDGYGDSRAHSLAEPAPTANCDGGGYVVEPFVLSRHGGGEPRSTAEPVPTQVAKHSHVLISPYYGSGSGETCRSADDPLPVATAKARFGMVMPVTHSDVSNRARDVETDPLATLTTAKRGELAFITAQFGERAGQAPRVHDLALPAPVICAAGHINLVETTGHDILFRMLEPHELAAAMGFGRRGKRYEFTGTKTEQVKQIGNAVEVNQMAANVYAIMQDDAAPAFLEAAE